MKFVKAISAALFAVMAFSTLAHATEVAGIKVDEKIHANGQDLTLNGAGLRSIAFFKVYVASLYLPAKSNSAPQILDSMTTARMNLRIMRDIEADTLYGALKEGFNANVPESEMSAMQPRLQQFAAIMRKVGSSHPGDVITIDFHADNVTLAMNGNNLGTLAAPRFGRALLSIWLGEHPVESGLKKALLGS